MMTTFGSGRKGFSFFLPFVLMALAAACGDAGKVGDAAKADDSASQAPCRDTFLEEGELAPALTLIARDGSETLLQDLGKGQPMLVDYWATWCAPCLAAMPHIEAIHQKYKEQGLKVIGVMADGNARKLAEKTIPGLRVSYEMLLDEDAERTACAWGPVMGYPTVLLLDGKGKVVGEWIGTGDVQKIEQAVEALYAENASS